MLYEKTPFKDQLTIVTLIEAFLILSDGSQLIRMQIILFFIVRRGEGVHVVIHRIQSWLTAPSHTSVFCQRYNVCDSFIS